MSQTKHFPGVVALALKRRKTSGTVAAAAIAVVLVGVAVAKPLDVLFAVFFDDQGTLQTKSSDPSTLNASNAFFDPSIGTNGQACVTCHQPSIGITVSVPFINQAFDATSGGTGPLDPLFRPNDTANNPHTNIFSKNPADYSLILNLGVMRIGKTVPTGAAADFTVVAADAATDAKFAAPDKFPLTTDPQHPGVPSLSVFRRPLVNTNVNFDSSVLWDGRADIRNMPAQVNGAIQTLLLGAGNDNEVNNEIADFMTGVFTDQKSSNLAGELTAVKATGGVGNLLALSESPSRPCVRDPAGALTPFVLEAGATEASCTPVVAAPNHETFNLFASWRDLPNNPGNAGRLSVARGEVVFNTASAGRAGGFGCATCHSVNDLGNNALAVGAGFRRDGTESPSIMQQVLAAAQLTGTQKEIQRVQDMIDRNNQLPLYCLRPTSDMTPGPCGTHATDVVTTDPGRALVTGKIADAGLFKPPILRNLAVRPPFFHAGVAGDSPAGSAMEHLVTFYNFRFNMLMTPDEQTDLVNFLNAL